MHFQPQLPFPSAPALPPGRFAPGGVNHDFRTSLALSQAYSEAPWWEAIYRQAFPSLISMVSVQDDGWAQRGGIDRVLTLASGRSYTVDEKVRMNDWPDILLEQWSDEQRRVPGWIQKPLACDFIAYAFAPSHRCYLLPVMPLQRAWRLCGRQWVDDFGQRRAINPGYVSTSVPVPVETLLGAMTSAMLVRGY
ncbi:hypothetical protein FHS91_003927 [Sphingobium xanthum]|uniref:hypothetical protein n=1 Tax=Sphingobium xanthum TaxID=1387165 RepID=UPI001FEAB91F|nr:hypothetical protein [Sphingobium xanthum]